MEAFHTLEDFSSFINEYLQKEQLIVLGYSYASEGSELSLLVTIDDYEMSCRWHAIWTFRGVRQALFQSLIEEGNVFTINPETLEVGARFLQQDLRFHAQQLEMTVFDEPDPLIRVVEVSFTEGGRKYSYRCDDPEIGIGDWVLVPVGASNHEKEAHVESLSYVTEEESPYPVEKMKAVLSKLEVVAIHYDVTVAAKGFLTFSGYSYEGREVGKSTDLLWVPFLASLDDLSGTTYGIRIDGQGDEGIYFTALEGQTMNQETIALGPSTYAVFSLKGPATAAIWEAWRYAKEHYDLLEQPSVEVYPAGNRQSKDYEMEVWIPIKEDK